MMDLSIQCVANSVPYPFAYRIRIPKAGSGFGFLSNKRKIQENNAQVLLCFHCPCEYPAYFFFLELFMEPCFLYMCPMRGDRNSCKMDLHI